jgi:hypothetical protein
MPPPEVMLQPPFGPSLMFIFSNEVMEVCYEIGALSNGSMNVIEFLRLNGYCFLGA